VLLAIAVKRDSVVDESTDQPQTTFWSVREKVKKRPLSRRSRNEIKVDKIKWSSELAAMAWLIGWPPLRDQSVLGKGCELLGRSLSQRAAEFQNVAHNIVVVPPLL
jgi:hypothetical protein